MSTEATEQQQEIAALMQIRAIYELTTDITKNCFGPCVPKLTPRMEESEKNCMSNCAANFLRMKMLFTHRLIESAKTISASIVGPEASEPSE
jgi:hypothetical protein